MVNFLINLIWKTVPNMLNIQTIFYPLIICIVGGLIIGFQQRRMPGYPRTMNQVIGEYKTTGKIRYTHEISKNFFNAITVLSFGGSVGPEAALSGILGGLINWVGDRMKLTLKRREELVNMGIGAILSTVFYAPFAGIGKAFDAPTRDFRVRGRKIFVYTITVISGVIGFGFMNRIFPHESTFGIHFRQNIAWTWQGFALIPVALVVGILFGKLFENLGKWSKQLTRNSKRTVLWAIVGGLIIGGAGMISPYYQFSGEANLLGFSRIAMDQSVWFLIMIGIGKAIITNLCFSLGWRGGMIFPAIFSSAATGFALSAILPFTPAILVSVTIAASLTSIMRQPGVVAGLLLLLLPIEVFPIIIIVCYLTNYLLKSLSRG
ncbi:chloride channel protein [Companilactobacillus hulinensis]|uniref:chloride channel protein n=1 Tax=Companilactobacillus hulinensis TaxID=2486007 RepID=UPI000F789EE9|nr:chloride channel protein [Companilactobacillus hulinensis]